MLVRGLSVINAEPILGLVRAHARRTTTQRLGVVYQIVASPSSRPSTCGVVASPAALIANQGTPADNNWQGLLDPFGAKPQPQHLISLGQALFLNSIIEGGIDGENLPMTLDLGVKLNMVAHSAGALVDVVG